MNVEIKATPPKPTIEADILVYGRHIGVIKQAMGAYFIYHAVLDSAVDGTTCYQGFGNTHDEALRDAITRSRQKYIEQLKEIDQLENLIWGDYEAN